MDSEVILAIEKSQSLTHSVNNIGLRDTSASKTTMHERGERQNLGIKSPQPTKANRSVNNFKKAMHQTRTKCKNVCV